MPRVNFFWIMGADNLEAMHKWYNWKKIFYLCPIVVFNRPNYFYKAVSSKASKYFWKYKVNANTLIIKKTLPLWSILNINLNYSSSTFIRNSKE